MREIGWHTAKCMNRRLNISCGKPKLYLNLLFLLKHNVLIVTLSLSQIQRKIVSTDQRTVLESQILTQNHGGLHRRTLLNRTENRPKKSSFQGRKLTGILLYLTLSCACISHHKDRVPHGQQFLKLDNLQTKQPVTGFL